MLFIMLCATVAKAQSNLNTENKPAKPLIDTNEVFTAVQKPSAFPGGNEKLHDYFQQNSKYPIATKKGQPVQIVYVTFIVQRDGTLSGIKVLRAVNPELDAEAIRLVAASGLWLPGEQSGYKVKQTSYAIIDFLKN